MELIIPLMSPMLPFFIELHFLNNHNRSSEFLIN
jgi:hypothetical protein